MTTTRRFSTVILGTIVRIDDEEGAVIVNFDDRDVTYPFGELDTLVPAFATTIHKSQGSEYPAVVIPSQPSTTSCLRETSSTRP
jgi:ATP-dependent exoDNAse (exonuclease V) alpha subunit